MRLWRFPKRFCDDARPYWVLFVGFIISNMLLVYTLYTRQPERYRSSSEMLTIVPKTPKTSVGVPLAQAANFEIPVAGQAGVNAKPTAQRVIGWLSDRGAKSGRTVAFIGMRIGDLPLQAQGEAIPGRPRRGVRVMAVQRTSTPHLSGLRRGDQIVSINKFPIHSLDDFERVVSQLGPDKGILFDLFRDGRFHYMTVESRSIVR